MQDVQDILTPPNLSYPEDLVQTEHKGKSFTKSGTESRLHQHVQKRHDQLVRLQYLHTHNVRRLFKISDYHCHTL